MCACPQSKKLRCAGKQTALCRFSSRKLEVVCVMYKMCLLGRVKMFHFHLSVHHRLDPSCMSPRRF